MKIFTRGTCICSVWKIQRFRAGQTVVILLCALQGIVRAAVEVTPQRTEETRLQIFKDDKVMRSPASLKLTLGLEGPEAESATQYGHVKLDEATDSKGASLIPPHDSFRDPSKFREYAKLSFGIQTFTQSQKA